MKPWQPYLKYNCVSCRYNEIGTKGRNRQFFIQHLLEALQRRLAPSFTNLRFTLEHGRIFMLPSGEDKIITPEQLECLRREIPALPGLSSVSPGFLVASTPEAIEECILGTFPEVYGAYAACTPQENRTYAMRVNRLDKNFPLRSEAMERSYAEKVLTAHPDLRVDLKHAGLAIEVDIRHTRAFVSYERINGAGGLPTGSAGGVLAMLSGGFDSPVACYEMMRRGCNVDFITFHSAPYTPPATVTKVSKLVRVLNQFQKRGRYVAVNLLPLQKAIRDNCQEKNRTVLYRRCMVRLAAVVATFFNDEALVTGDNLGQVASQTLRNLGVIEAASPMMILRPLLTFDKLQIMEVADRIGTKELSMEDVPDSCTVFAPKNPSTKALASDIEADEANIPGYDELFRECLRNTVIINAVTGAEHPFTELLNLPLPWEKVRS